MLFRFSSPSRTVLSSSRSGGFTFMAPLILFLRGKQRWARGNASKWGDRDMKDVRWYRPEIREVKIFKASVMEKFFKPKIRNPETGRISI